MSLSTIDAINIFAFYKNINENIVAFSADGEQISNTGFDNHIFS